MSLKCLLTLQAKYFRVAKKPHSAVKLASNFRIPSGNTDIPTHAVHNARTPSTPSSSTLHTWFHHIHSSCGRMPSRQLPTSTTCLDRHLLGRLPTYAVYNEQLGYGRITAAADKDSGLKMETAFWNRPRIGLRKTIVRLVKYTYIPKHWTTPTRIMTKSKKTTHTKSEYRTKRDKTNSYSYQNPSESVHRVQQCIPCILVKLFGRADTTSKYI